MAGLQIAFFCQLSAELAETLWHRTWWSQILDFMHRLDSMDEGSLHPDILSDNIHDALGNPECCNWAAGLQKQSASLGLPSESLRFQVAIFAMLITLLFARPC